MGIGNGKEQIQDLDNGTDLSSPNMNFMRMNYGDKALSLI